METYTGTPGADVHTGGASDLTAGGYGGDDFLSVGPGGGVGRLAGGDGADTLIGGDGADILASGNADIFMGSFNPFIDTGREHDSLLGGGGNDTLHAGYGDDVDGGAGFDDLRLSLAGSPTGVTFNTASLMGGGSVTIGGGVIQHMETVLYLRGSDFADTLTMATTGGNVTVDGGGGDDVIVAQGDITLAYGGAGNDRFVAGSAGASFDGGDGYDIADFSGVTGPREISLIGSGPGDYMIDVELVIGSKYGDVFFVGARNAVQLGAGADLVSVTAGSHSSSGQSAVVTVMNWTAADSLQFGRVGGAYRELTAGSFDEAAAAAQAQHAAGYNLVAVQVASDVYVFGTPVSGQAQLDDAVKLVGVDLSSVSADNVGVGSAIPTSPIAPTDGEPSDPGLPFMGLLGNYGGPGVTRLQGNDSPELFLGSGGPITIMGAGGNDVIIPQNGATPGDHTYIRGEDGDDYVKGSDGFDDINGNKGNDTIVGGEGDDWVVGGQDQDFLFGDNGDDIVYGNLGNDTASGGAGDDWVRGGQGDDVIYGGTGADFMSGDRGNDTIYGGAGADRFNLIAGAESDRVMDFNAAEGDYVTIEGNLPYSLSFVDGDAIIDIGNGDRMILVGIASSAQLGANWLH